MHVYDSVAEAMNDLKKRGYTEDFNLAPDHLHCAALDLQVHPEAFMVDEFYRFEGESNPSDNAVVYAISSKDGLKGVLVDAYGMYADSLSQEMIEKLKVLHND